MRILQSRAGLALVVVLVLALGLVGLVVVRVQQLTHPPRHDDGAIDFEAMKIRFEEVRFAAADGVELDGWLLAGRPDRPPVVLCHDLGSSKGSLINLGIALGKVGFPVLMFDFRGHGRSEGEGSTLGVVEKRDILGAVDFLHAANRYPGSRVGVYGVGMGAHAAVLAAADRPALKVLVLDGLYPDASYPLVRGVYAHWPRASRWFDFLPRSAYAVMTGSGARDQAAETTLGGLLGRDLLFLVPAGDTELAGRIHAMYEQVPVQADADGNLVVLPETQGGALYAEDLSRYRERVVGFFEERLGDALPLSARARPAD